MNFFISTYVVGAIVCVGACDGLLVGAIDVFPGPSLLPDFDFDFDLGGGFGLSFDFGFGLSFEPGLGLSLEWPGGGGFGLSLDFDFDFDFAFEPDFDPDFDFDEGKGFGEISSWKTISIEYKTLDTFPTEQKHMNFHNAFFDGEKKSNEVSQILHLRCENLTTLDRSGEFKRES